MAVAAQVIRAQGVDQVDDQVGPLGGLGAPLGRRPLDLGRRQGPDGGGQADRRASFDVQRQLEPALVGDRSQAPLTGVIVGEVDVQPAVAADEAAPLRSQNGAGRGTHVVVDFGAEGNEQQPALGVQARLGDGAAQPPEAQPVPEGCERPVVVGRHHRPATQLVAHAQQVLAAPQEVGPQRQLVDARVGLELEPAGRAAVDLQLDGRPGAFGGPAGAKLEAEGQLPRLVHDEDQLRVGLETPAEGAPGSIVELAVRPAGAQVGHIAFAADVHLVGLSGRGGEDEVVAQVEDRHLGGAGLPAGGECQQEGSRNQGAGKRGLAPGPVAVASRAGPTHPGY